MAGISGSFFCPKPPESAHPSTLKIIKAHVVLTDFSEINGTDILCGFLWDILFKTKVYVNISLNHITLGQVWVDLH